MLKKIFSIILVGVLSLGVTLYSKGFLIKPTNIIFDSKNVYKLELVGDFSTMGQELNINSESLRNLTLEVSSDSDGYSGRLKELNKKLLEFKFTSGNLNIKTFPELYLLNQYIYLERSYPIYKPNILENNNNFNQKPISPADSILPFNESETLTKTDINPSQESNLDTDLTIANALQSGRWLNIKSTGGVRPDFKKKLEFFNKNKTVISFSDKNINQSSLVSTFNLFIRILSTDLGDLALPEKFIFELRNKELYLKFNNLEFKVTSKKQKLSINPTDSISLSSITNESNIEKSLFESNVGVLITDAKAISKLENKDINMDIVLRAAKEIKINENLSYLPIDDYLLKIFDSSNCILLNLQTSSLSSKEC